MQVKIKKSTPLGKLTGACCSHFGLHASQVGFWIGGERVAPDDAAEKLGLGGEGRIVVALQRTPGPRTRVPWLAP